MTGPARHDLLAAVLDEHPVVERTHVSRVELAPGQEPGLHRHPGHVVGYVLAGTIRFQVADEPPRLLHPGDAFHEPAGVPIPHFDNASPTEPATFLACYLLPPAEDRLIEMLD